MSFEDDMIEDGFNDEQDYLDYLCSEADRQASNEEFTEEDYARFARERLRWKPMETWEQNATPKQLALWHAVRSSYSRVVRLWGTLDAPDYWSLWMKSDGVYEKWYNEHKDAIAKLQLKEFQDYYDQYVKEHKPKDVLRFNSGLLALSDKPFMNDGAIDEEKIRFQAWKEEFVPDDSTDTILYKLWVKDNNEEWHNWLHANYPRLKTILYRNKSYQQFKSGLLDSHQLYNNKPSNLLIQIITEHMSDWWDYYALDIKEKFQKANSLGYDLLFEKITRRAVARKANKTVVDRIKWFKVSSLQELTVTIDTDFRVRPQSHPELDGVKIVLPGAFRGDLYPDMIDEDEEKEIWDEVVNRRRIRRHQLNDEWEADLLGFLDDDLSEEQTLAIEKRNAIELEKAKLSASLLNKKTKLKLGPKSFRDYTSLLPKKDQHYEDYEYLGLTKREVIYYFLKNSLKQDAIDQLVDEGRSDFDYQYSLYNYRFRYKKYKDNRTFEASELSYEDFNIWCYRHNLPTLMDYLLKYWFDNKANPDELLCDIWLRFWRGRAWIECTYGNDLSQEQIYELWTNKHSKDWAKWLRHRYSGYKKEYLEVLRLSSLIHSEDITLKEVLRNIDSEVVRSYLDTKKEDFNKWLHIIPGRYQDFKVWKKENTFILSLLNKRYDKIHILYLWNKAYPNDKIIIHGLND